LNFFGFTIPESISSIFARADFAPSFSSEN
jgi:hypothetical protein